MPGWRHLPVVALTDLEVAAIAKGQFVRPAAGLPAIAERYRLRDPDGALVAIASAPRGGWRRTRCSWPRARRRNVRAP